MATKATAPAPPPTSLTGQIPNPTLREKFFHWNRNRRAQRLSRPPRPININVGSGPPAPSTKRRRTTRLPRGHTYRRRPTRGKLAAILGLTIATVTVAMAVAEFATWEAATELGTLAQFISLGTAYCFGEPSDRAKLKKAQQANQPPKPPRQRQPAKAPQKSAGHRCGAPTQDGSACNRPVKNALDHCWEHPGGKGTGPAKKTSIGPKRTKTKGAAPPSDLKDRKQTP